MRKFANYIQHLPKKAKAGGLFAGLLLAVLVVGVIVFRNSPVDLASNTNKAASTSTAKDFPEQVSGSNTIAESNTTENTQSVERDSGSLNPATGQLAAEPKRLSSRPTSNNPGNESAPDFTLSTSSLAVRPGEFSPYISFSSSGGQNYSWSVDGGSIFLIKDENFKGAQTATGKFRFHTIIPSQAAGTYHIKIRATNSTSSTVKLITVNVATAETLELTIGSIVRSDNRIRIPLHITRHNPTERSINIASDVLDNKPWPSGITFFSSGMFSLTDGFVDYELPAGTGSFTFRIKVFAGWGSDTQATKIVTYSF